jgi:hypothetical protein
MEITKDILNNRITTGIKTSSHHVMSSTANQIKSYQLQLQYYRTLVKTECRVYVTMT